VTRSVFSGVPIIRLNFSRRGWFFFYIDNIDALIAGFYGG
jgi:hypothetical protein